MLPPIHPEDSRSETFRNPNGVARKTFDIATRHPDYRGKQTNGGTLDTEVLQDFLHGPAAMADAARPIHSGIATGDLGDLPVIADDEL